MGKTTMAADPPINPCADRRVSKDWVPFAQNLSQVLASLEEDQFLILAAKHGNRFLQFSCQGAWGLRVEVASNHFLANEDRLQRREMAWLRKHGWLAPTGTPRQATPEKDPDGSPNYFIDFPSSAATADIVALVIDTLIHGLALPYPGALTYESFDRTRGPLTFEALGLMQAGGMENEEGEGSKGSEGVEESETSAVMHAVRAVLREVTGLEDLPFDEDGDLTLHYGRIEIVVIELEHRVRLFSALATEMAETPALLRKLNTMNVGTHQTRVCWLKGIVYAVLDVPSDPFVPAHLAAAINEFSEVAEGLAIVLNAEAAGQAVIASSDPVTYLQ